MSLTYVVWPVEPIYQEPGILEEDWISVQAVAVQVASIVVDYKSWS